MDSTNLAPRITPFDKARFSRAVQRIMLDTITVAEMHKRLTALMDANRNDLKHIYRWAKSRRIEESTWIIYHAAQTILQLIPPDVRAELSHPRVQIGNDDYLSGDESRRHLARCLSLGLSKSYIAQKLGIAAANITQIQQGKQRAHKALANLW